jgi:hypothetical protein
MVELRHDLRPEAVGKIAKLLLELEECVFYAESVAVKTDECQRIKF